MNCCRSWFGVGMRRDCPLLSPVLLGEIPQRQRERYFRQPSREERRLPNGQRRRISVRTFQRKWRELTDNGVPGLCRRRRANRGKPLTDTD